jgi:hypothetical protein
VTELLRWEKVSFHCSTSATTFLLLIVKALAGLLRFIFVKVWIAMTLACYCVPNLPLMGRDRWWSGLAWTFGLHNDARNFHADVRHADLPSFHND